MKKINLIVLLMISTFAYTQNYTIKSISYHKKLFSLQKYVFTPPTGFRKYYTCADSMTFCIIKGKFKKGIKINAEEIQLILKDNSTALVVGAVRNKNVPEITRLSYSENLSNNDSPIFIIKKGAKPKTLIMQKEKINIKARVTKREFKITNIPKFEILSTKLYNKISDNTAKLEPGYVGDRTTYHVELDYVPVKGKILCIEANISNVNDEADYGEIAIYDDNSFIGNVIVTQESFGLSVYSNLTNSSFEPTKLYFIVGKNFTKGKLYFNDTFIQSFKVK